ncbi:transposase [Streptomyces sp. NPDC093097]|uniref:transposase n=1 Tax=Streptomyces sp. NPDC093097 TaxID=3366027 RepID=UPI0037F5FB3D
MVHRLSRQVHRGGDVLVPRTPRPSGRPQGPHERRPAPGHRSKTVWAWLEKHAERLELHLMPGYSPELNPDELLNAGLKHHVQAPRAAFRRRQDLALPAPQKTTTPHRLWLLQSPPRALHDPAGNPPFSVQ